MGAGTSDSQRCGSGVLIGRHPATRRVLIIPRTCGRWDCPKCREWKARRYHRLIWQARPERHITLTCNPRRYKSPEEALDDLKRALPKLAKALRAPEKSKDGTIKKAHKTFEYAAVFEKHKSGWPHIHLATWGDFIPVQFLRRHWQRLTGASIVDIRRIDNNRPHLHNFVKYLADKTKWPAGCNTIQRRISFSRGYHRNAQPTPKAQPAQGWEFTFSWHAPCVLYHYLRLTHNAREILTDAPDSILLECDDLPPPNIEGYLDQTLETWLQHAREGKVQLDDEAREALAVYLATTPKEAIQCLFS